MTIPAIHLVEIQADDLQKNAACASDALAEAAEALTRSDVLVLRIRPVERNLNTAIENAKLALRRIHRSLVDNELLPPESYVELDEESRGVPVAPFRSRRFLLPHQDGGHCSYLTPSLLDCTTFDLAERVFSSDVYWRKPSHKLFQGLLVTNVGITPGTTYYYNAISLLGAAFNFQIHRPPADCKELAEFAMTNLRRSRKLQDQHGSRYLTLGAFLGARKPDFHVSPSGPRGESEFWPAQYLNLPELAELAEQCPCGECDGPGARLLCHACKETLGANWPEMRAVHEMTVVARRYDLVLANNLTLFHAADSDQTRTLIPMCIVMSKAEGTAYECWLAGQWRSAGVIQ